VPKVDSSAVERIDYAPRTGTLDVWYAGGGHYCYFDVASETYSALIRADSIGGFVNRQIKPNHRYREIAERRRFRPE
jgi:hypothetical protein